MKIYSTVLAEVDSICDYIPVVSTATNLVDLFLKCVCKCFSKDCVIICFWSHIERKDCYRSLALFVPILGNIYIFFSDLKEYYLNKSYLQKNPARNGSEEMLRQCEALFVNTFAGTHISEQSLKRAPTKEQEQMWAAASLNDLEWMKELLEKGVNPNFSDSGKTPLTIASLQSPSMAKLLIKHGADVNLKDSLGCTPLFSACMFAQYEVVELLLQRKADVNVSSLTGETPFMLAAGRGNLKIVELLYPYVTDINQACKKGVTALMRAASQDRLDVVDFLLKKGVDLHKKALVEVDALQLAILFKRDKVVERLIQSESNLDRHKYKISCPVGFFGKITVENMTPFLFATLIQNKECALALLDKSDVTECSSLQKTALHHSVKNLELLEKILAKCDSSAFVNKQDVEHATALHTAIYFKEPKSALLLLEKGADPFLKDSNEKTALLLAAENGLKEVVDAIFLKFPRKITPELKAVLEEALKKSPSQKEKPKEMDYFSSLFKGVMTGVEIMGDRRSDRAISMQQKRKFGDEPLTGMEILFGKLHWPEVF